MREELLKTCQLIGRTQLCEPANCVTIQDGKKFCEVRMSEEIPMWAKMSLMATLMILFAALTILAAIGFDSYMEKRK
jgi:hypothetical protein